LFVIMAIAATTAAAVVVPIHWRWSVMEHFEDFPNASLLFVPTMVRRYQGNATRSYVSAAARRALAGELTPGKGMALAVVAPDRSNQPVQMMVVRGMATLHRRPVL
jgi:hypothetical protein